MMNRIFRIEEMDFRDRRLKARWVAPSKAGAERVSIHLFHSVHSVDSVRSDSALSLFPVFLIQRILCCSVRCLQRSRSQGPIR